MAIYWTPRPDGLPPRPVRVLVVLYYLGAGLLMTGVLGGAVYGLWCLMTGLALGTP